MKCFTYTNGETLAGINLDGTVNQNTCAIKLQAPLDWDIDELQLRIRNKTHADILLYCYATLTDGDSVSSVFPEGCILIRSTDPVDTINHNNSCLEVCVTADYLDLILMDQSCMYDVNRKVYIKNDKGNLIAISEGESKREEAAQGYDFDADSVELLL